MENLFFGYWWYCPYKKLSICFRILLLTLFVARLHGLISFGPSQKKGE
jgi:hypothetical protein